MPQYTTIFVRKPERDAAKRVQEAHVLRHASDALAGLLKLYEIASDDQRKQAFKPPYEAPRRRKSQQSAA